MLDALDRLAGTLREGLVEIGRAGAFLLAVLGRDSSPTSISRPRRSDRPARLASDLLRRRALDYRLLAAGIYNAPVHRYHLLAGAHRG